MTAMFKIDKRLIQAIEKFLTQCYGENWNGVAEKASRLGMWEFEDYIPA